MRATTLFASLGLISSALVLVACDQSRQSDMTSAESSESDSGKSNQKTEKVISLADSHGTDNSVTKLILQADIRKPSPWGNYLAGLHALTHRDLSNAGRFLGQVLEKDPTNQSLMLRTFLIYVSEAQMDKAEQLADQIMNIPVAEGKKRLVPATVQLLRILRSVKRSEWSDAEDRLALYPNRDIASLVRPFLESWLAMAEYDSDSESLSEKQQRLDQALAPLDIDGRPDILTKSRQLQKALIYDMFGDEDKAEAAYIAAGSEGLSPTYYYARLFGNFLSRIGKKEEARDLYQAFLDENPESLVFNPTLRDLENDIIPEPIIKTIQDGIGDSLFNLATLIRRDQSFDIALLYTQMSLDLSPHMMTPRLLQGEIYENQHRYQNAIDVYKAIPEGTGLFLRSQLRIAKNLERLEHIDQAADILERLAGKYPKRSDILAELGNMYRTNMRIDEAVIAYDRAFERIDTLDVNDWPLLYSRGMALERAGQWERAEADFLKALEFAPEQPYILNYLGYSWVQRGEHLDKAQDMIQRAVEQQPDDGYIVDSLGWVFYQLKEYKKAVIHLERAVALRPQDPVINDHLGDAYWKVGRFQEAKFQWKRALSLKPESDLIPEVEKKLAQGL